MRHRQAETPPLLPQVLLCTRTSDRMLDAYGMNDTGFTQCGVVLPRSFRLRHLSFLVSRICGEACETTHAATGTAAAQPVARRPGAQTGRYVAAYSEATVTEIVLFREVARPSPERTVLKLVCLKLAQMRAVGEVQNAPL